MSCWNSSIEHIAGRAKDRVMYTSEAKIADNLVHCIMWLHALVDRKAATYLNFKP